MNITSNFHHVTKVALGNVERCQLDDGCIYYRRSMKFTSEGGVIGHTLFAESAEALTLPDEKLKTDNAKRISGLRTAVKEVQRLLPYADHRAYGQDQQRISRMQTEIRQLENQSQQQQ